MSTAAELSDLGLGEDIQSLSTQELLERYKKDGDEALKWAIVLRYEGLIKSVALQVRSVYSGFAFGFGIDRIAMIKYGIPNIKLLYENDVRFLKQFN